MKQEQMSDVIDLDHSSFQIDLMIPDLSLCAWKLNDVENDDEEIEFYKIMIYQLGWFINE